MNNYIVTTTGAPMPQISCCQLYVFILVVSGTFISKFCQCVWFFEKRVTVHQSHKTSCQYAIEIK